jgi:hypothetical protein
VGQSGCCCCGSGSGRLCTSSTLRENSYNISLNPKPNNSDAPHLEMMELASPLATSVRFH